MMPNKLGNEPTIHLLAENPNPTPNPLLTIVSPPSREPESLWPESPKPDRTCMLTLNSESPL